MVKMEEKSFAFHSSNFVPRALSMYLVVSRTTKRKDLWNEVVLLFYTQYSYIRKKEKSSAQVGKLVLAARKLEANLYSTIRQMPG